MNPTIYDGDTLLVSKLYKQLKHGEIVIVKDKDIDSSYLIKRIIAIGGDYLYIYNGKVSLNGKILIEQYLKEGWDKGYYSGTIPEGFIYVMGDNRNMSCDSRHFGLVNTQQVKGKVLFK